MAYRKRSKTSPVKAFFLFIAALRIKIITPKGPVLGVLRSHKSLILVHKKAYINNVN